MQDNNAKEGDTMGLFVTGQGELLIRINHPDLKPMLFPDSSALGEVVTLLMGCQCEKCTCMLVTMTLVATGVKTSMSLYSLASLAVNLCHTLACSSMLLSTHSSDCGVRFWQTTTYVWHTTSGFVLCMYILCNPRRSAADACTLM